MADRPDLYKILQVDPEADADIIQAAYRRLAHKYHPDLAASNDGGARMIAINGAWEVLGDPARRAAYDGERTAGTAGQAAEAGGSAPADRRPGGGPPGGSPSAGAGTGAGGPGGGGPRTPGGGAGRTTIPGEGVEGNRRPGEPAASSWTSGRSSAGGGYDPATMRSADGHGAAGRPPGHPSGSVLNFGRYAGWSMGEIARIDIEYLEWLERSPIGRQYGGEIDGFLRRAGRRRTVGDDKDRRGLFRRR